MPLTDLNSIKTANGIALTNTTDDAWITLVQPSVEAALQKWIGYNIAQATYTEYYDGNNTRLLLLKQLPVYTVGNVWIQEDGQDGNNPTPFATPEDPFSYWLELDGPGAAYSATGKLHRGNQSTPNTTTPGLNSGIWPGCWTSPWNRLSKKEIPGAGNIKIQYLAGYSPVPQDIQLAVWESMGQLRAMRRFGYLGPIKSEGLSASSYSLGDLYKAIYMLGAVQQILSMYRRLPI
jgi:hypothetical protein